MKNLRKSWKRPGLPTWAACAAACFYGIPAPAQAQDAVPAGSDEPKLSEGADADADYSNWFDVSVGGTLVRGNKAAFQQSTGLPNGAFGGVTDFHYEQYVGKRGIFEVDGRGIFDEHNYSLRLNLEDPDIGYVRAGYSEFRSYYDRSGGYLPLNDLWVQPFDDEAWVDRGDAWIELGLTLPERPIIKFRYDHQFRNGTKGSTSWGDTTLGGLPSARGVTASFWDLDETRDIFSLDAEHTISDTRFGVGLRYDTSEQSDSRNIIRSASQTNERYLTQREVVDTDLFNVHAFQETWFTDQLLFTTGYSFTTLDTDVGGSRIYGSDFDSLYDPLFARRQQRDEGFIDLQGGSALTQHVMNLNLMFTPVDNLNVIASLRAENQDMSGIAKFEETNVGSPPLFTSTADPLLNTRERGFTDVTEGLQVRYTGITNWVFYASGEWLEGEGDLSERELQVDTGTLGIFRDTDSGRFTQKYATGFNWYPMRKLNFSGQYYHKSRKNDYDHTLDSTVNTGPDRYPAFIRDQNFDTDDVNFRVTFRPWTSLSLVSRYDFQLSTVDSRMDQLAEVQSAEITSHIFGESLTWTPLARLFLQASVNYALDRTFTPAVDQLAGIVQRSDNDYIDGSLTAGYALTEKTDLQAQYFLYYADNYLDNSAVSVPYNASAEEHGITATIIHRFTSAMQGTLKYGWFSGVSKTSGGRNDFEGHLLYSSLRYRF